MAQKFLTNIDLNKNELQNAKIQNLATAPPSPADGQIYFDTESDSLKVYNGTVWIDLQQQGDITEVTTSGGLTGGGASGSVDVSIAILDPAPTGLYGSSSAIPVITVNNKGQVTAASTASISTTLAFTDDSSTAASVSLNGGTLSILGGTGVTTLANDSSDSLTVSIGQDVGTTADVTFNTVSADLTGSVTGNASTASALATARTIEVSGAVAGSASFDGSANINISTSVQADTVTLGTHTVGEYVESITGGTGVTVTGGTGEGSTPSIAIGQAVGTSDSVTFNDVTVSGNLVVSGDTTTVNTATLTVEDPLIVLASGNNATDAVDIGFYGVYDTSGTQDLYAGLFRDASDGKFRLFKDLQSAPTTTVDLAGTGYTVASLVANLEGNVTGNLTGDVTGNASTATALETARTIGGVSFDGTVNIDLPGVNTTGNQDTSGNAATATALETARTINDVSFDGTANITVTAAAGTLTGDELNSTVVTSYLTTVGTISSGTWNGSTIAIAYGGTGASNAAGARLSIGATASGLIGTTLARIAAVDCAASVDVPGQGHISTTTVTHNFGTRDVMVQVYDTSTYDTVYGDVVRTTTNVVTVTLNGTITAGEYRIVVTAA